MSVVHFDPTKGELCIRLHNRTPAESHQVFHRIGALLQQLSDSGLRAVGEAIIDGITDPTRDGLPGTRHISDGDGSSLRRPGLRGQ